MSDSPRVSRTRRTVIAATSVLVAAGIVWAVVANSAPTGEQAARVAPSATATTTPTPSAAPGDSTALPTETVTAALGDYFTVIDGLSGDSELQEFERVAAGAALSEIESQLLEFGSNEWTLRGTPRLEGLTVTESDLSGDTPSATVQVCVDSSDVVVVRADGEPAFTVDPRSVRALNLYSLQLIDDSWRVTGHTFPDNADC